MVEKRLNLCCGTDIKDNWDNADIQKHKAIIYCDINSFPYPFKNNSYDYILLRGGIHYAEHPEKVLEELRRITKDGGIIEVTEIPYYNNKGAVTCLGTKSFFSEKTFLYHISRDPKIKLSWHYEVENLQKFKILKMQLTPTRIGKLIFSKKIRERLSCIIGGLIGSIDIRLKVINK